MSDKINLKDFKKEYSSLIGKEVYLQSKSNVRYHGILRLIDTGEIWLKSAKPHGMRLEDMAGKFGIEIKQIGAESDVYIIKSAEIESISPVSQTPPSLKPTTTKPDQEAKAKNNENVTIDIQFKLAETKTRTKTIKPKQTSPSPPLQPKFDQAKFDHQTRRITSQSIEKLEEEIFEQSRNRKVLAHLSTPEKDNQLLYQQVPSLYAASKPTDLSPILDQSAIYTLTGSDMTGSAIMTTRFHRLLQCDYCTKALNDPIYLPCCGKTVCRSDLVQKIATCVICKQAYQQGQVFHSNEKIADLLLLRKNLYEMDDMNMLEIDSSKYFSMLINKCELKREELKQEIDKYFENYKNKLNEKEANCKAALHQGNSILESMRLVHLAKEKMNN